MPELDPAVKERLEDHLRAHLRSAADDAPPFRGLQQPTHHKRSIRGFVAIGLATASVVAVVGVSGALSNRNQETPQASCPARLVFNETHYNGFGGLYRIPATAASLGHGLRPGCDDGNGSAPNRRIAVSNIAGVDPRRAVIADDVVWVNADRATLPDVIQRARRPVACTLNGTASISGTWLSVQARKQPRFDGDLQAPYTIGMLVRDAQLVHDGWQSVIVTVAVTDVTSAPGPEDVEKLLQGGATALVTLHCDGDRFVADVLSPA